MVTGSQQNADNPPDHQVTRERLTVGVLGGLGPEATVDFLRKIVDATPATSDQDHIHLLIDHNPGVPNRHASIAGRAPSVGPQLAQMAQRLEAAGADFLVMVCNTAHAFEAEISAAVSIPFLSIIDVTVAALSDSGAARVGVMAAEGCLQAGLYQQALGAAGYEAILWSDSELEEFMALIYRIKAGQRHADIAEGIARLAASLVTRGADTLIAGCTEIPLFLHAQASPAPLFQSTDLLVQRTIALAKGDT
ncbi:MAG: amino acid racemase [Halioglobus sp.]|nr:amino acid racemase [Halioglobus sp.]